MPAIRKILIVSIFLFQGSIFGFAQTNIDSLQEVLNELDKTQTDSIVEISKKIFENSDSDLVKYNALGTIINAYSLKNERKKALPYLSEAKKIAEEMSDPQLKSKAYLTMSSLYTSIGLTQQAHLYLQKSILIINQLPENQSKKELSAFVNLESGNLFQSENKFDTAHYFYKKSLLNFAQIIDKEEDNSGLIQYYKYATYGVGKSLLDLNKLDSSEIYLVKALNISNDLDPGLDFHIKKELSSIYTAHTQYSRAIDTLQTILNHPNLDQIELEAEVYKSLTGNYKALGDEEKYIFYNEKYLELNSKINQNNISTINKVFENEKVEYSRFNFYWILGLVLIIGISIVGLVWFKILRNKKNSNSDKLSPSEISSKQPEKIVVPIEVEKNILKGLDEFETNLGFTNQKLNISNLANQLETNTTYLSEVIKRNKGKNFSNYINELRINFICNEIDAKPEYRNYKISYLAELCGFNSHSFFATVFRNVTGISPSEYLENSSKQN